MSFILFNPDEIRAESLGYYGHPAVWTDNTDSLAQAGTFTHPVDTPSRGKRQ